MNICKNVYNLYFIFENFLLSFTWYFKNWVNCFRDAYYLTVWYSAAIEFFPLCRLPLHSNDWCTLQHRSLQFPVIHLADSCSWCLSYWGPIQKGLSNAYKFQGILCFLLNQVHGIMSFFEALDLFGVVLHREKDKILVSFFCMQISNLIGTFFVEDTVLTPVWIF